MLVQGNSFSINNNQKLSNPSFGAESIPDTEAQTSVKEPENAVVTSNLVAAYFNNIKTPQKANAAQQVTNTQQTSAVDNSHNLRTRFENNQAVIYALVPRTFNAKDADNNELIERNEESGTFLNAIDRLDELKSYGVNTLHILPCYKPGEKAAMGTAGSIYSVADFNELDPKLDDKTDPRNVDEEFKTFTDECHKRGIAVMLDIPGCASLDLYYKHPELMAKNERGIPEIPQGWRDIRMFQPWADKDKKVLNKALVDYHEQFMKKYLDLGVDGFRIDVARAKPTEFWNEVIPFARKINPECGFLAESYTYEDASPMMNVPADRPEDLLKAGFDSYYGQYHIFNEWDSAKEFHDNMIQNLKMSEDLPGKKSLIGSFATHDDKSPMSNGGSAYCNLTTGLQETLPMTNPYFVSGFESGDRYNYSYRNKPAEDGKTFYTHPEKIDIFNLSRKPGGHHPEIGEYMKQMAEVRKQYEDVITKGSYIPLKTTNKSDKIIAYARHLNGKTLLVVANKDVNATQNGEIEIPGITSAQKMVDIAPKYGADAQVEASNNKLKVNLPAAKFMMFEIDTPEIEKKMEPNVYKQNNI